MSTFNISSNVPKDAQLDILRRGMEQASSEVFRIAMDLLLDPDTLAEGWTAEASGYDETSSLWASAELLEFHLKRYHNAKNKLEAMS